MFIELVFKLLDVRFGKILVLQAGLLVFANLVHFII